MIFKCAKSGKGQKYRFIFIWKNWMYPRANGSKPSGTCVILLYNHVNMALQSSDINVTAIHFTFKVDPWVLQ